MREKGWNPIPMPPRSLHFNYISYKVCLKMFLQGLVCVLSGLLLQTISVHGDTCQYDSETKICSEGCCETDCCSESFWNWYVIIGIVVAGIFGLIFIVGLIILMCVYCVKSKHSSRRDTFAMDPNRVHPSNNRLYPPPYSGSHGQALPPPPPPYSEFEAPPKYEAIHLTPQVRSSVVPRPQRSSGVPVRTNSRTVNHT